ncbi:hypothetical protein P2P98_03165 [Microbacterium sp. Kw_RZR3]|uniref:hypothetical protein n=1 Tax=Microbacterium sp. Kw_RZR3 TaxID=3032903 RepID=UPI0023DB446C|nr:hypothetical protein [Microbacterium sp. Kw_RZR3]MDF2045149.1 hypothetical protein [Microbacterium sp. Kw_RZR3]
MRVQVAFPMLGNPSGHPTEARRNHKTIRETLLLDTENSGVEKALVTAAQRAARPGQEVFVTRTYSRAGRLSVWIVDRSTTGSLRNRKQELRAALASVQI